MADVTSSRPREHIDARTPEELEALNRVSPSLTAALRARPFAIDASDVLTFRKLRADHLKGLRQYMPLCGKPIPEVDERDETCKMRDGESIRVRVYTPVEPRRIEGGGPLILMFHEGGFKFGDLTDEDMNCRLFARDLRAVCVNVEYRLAPEHKFPTWINDSWDTTKYFAANPASYHADPAKGFIVGGSSAGGNISAILSHLSRLEELDPPITGQYLSVPYLFPTPFEDLKAEYQAEFVSYANNNDPVLAAKSEDNTKRNLATIGADTTSYLYNVLAKSIYPPKLSDTDRALAPAYIQVAGLDPLRDHALVYQRILNNEYGTETKLDIYSGFGHMFWTNWPEMEESHAFINDTVNGIRWLLEQTEV